MNELNKIRGLVKEKSPLIHSITNPISINQCANAVLALGARPIMAEHPEEVCEITASSQALVLNLGNITDVRMKSMMLSAETASKKDIPFVIDAVGIACSTLRKNFIYTLLDNYKPDVIKGNYSEINALYNAEYESDGVDSENLDVKAISETAVFAAKKYNTIILASGKVDIVTDGRRLVYVKNGTSMLSKLTGTGCILGSLCGCFLAVKRDISAAVTACAVLGISGELAEYEKGNGSFGVSLMDKLSVFADEDIENNLRLEEKEIEKT